MNQNGPLVSVIVPAYNAEKYLGEALESALAQTRQDVEIILVDDGSTDGTAAIARSFGARVQLVQQENRGVGGAVNTGLRRARGDLLAFLDADDRWLADKLSLQVSWMEAHPETDLVFGHARQFISPEIGPEDRLRLAGMQEAPEPGFMKLTMLARRRAFEQVGEFSEGLRAGDFVDWYMRAMEAGLQVHMLPEVLAERRIHLGNTGMRDPGSQQDYVRVVRSALLRRRRTGPQ